MSRKTRKEKIAAEQRRKTQILYTVPATLVHQSISSGNYSTLTLDNSVSLPQTKINMDYSYVLSDLRRILLLTTLAFCAQFVLWYFLENKL